LLCERIIARLDVKGSKLIKGIHLEGLRIIGDPHIYAKKYEESGADEIIFIDTVASLYGRENLVKIVEKTSKKIFIPLTAGGGVRTIEDIQALLNAGADKVAINTAAVNDPSLITRAVKKFGSQCIVVSVDAKRKEGKWEVYTENGREPSGKTVFEWIKQVIELGAGEIFLTSIDNEGTKQGFDLELIKKTAAFCTVPLIIAGGAGNIDHIKEIFAVNIAGVALASILHYNTLSINEIKENLKDFANIRPKRI